MADPHYMMTANFQKCIAIIALGVSLIHLLFRL